MQDFEEMSDPTLQQNVSQASNPAGFPAGRGANMPCGQGFRSARERTAARAAVGSVVNVTSGRVGTRGLWEYAKDGPLVAPSFPRSER